jgi:hypothetical protein
VDRQGLGLEAVVGHGDPSMRRARPHGTTRRDHAGVDAGPVEAAEQAPVLDLDAAVHDDLEPGAGGERGGGLVPDADLLPQALRADRDRFLGDRHDVFSAPEDIDDVDRDVDRRQRRVAAFAEDLVVARIDRNDPVAVLLQVLGGEVARPVPFGREADDGDRPARSQDAAKGRDVVGHGRWCDALTSPGAQTLPETRAPGQSDSTACSRPGAITASSASAPGGHRRCRHVVGVDDLVASL